VSAIDQTAARLLNLIIVLMAHPHGLSRDQLMNLLGITEERTFERLKDALRSAMGVALEESDQGIYRLGADGYAMPPVRFTPPEHAAIALALGAWRGSEVEWAARGAMTKLAPLGSPELAAEPGGAGPDPADGLDMALYAPTEGASELIVAIAERRRVTFEYVTGATGQSARRHVEPWRLAKRGGAWYLFGFDLDRGAERVYKLGRITGLVRATGRAGAFESPEQGQTAARLEAALDRDDGGPAVICASPEAGRVLASQGARHVKSPPEATDGSGSYWEIPRADIFVLAGWGEAIKVISPEESRGEVIERWRAAAKAHEGPARPPGAYGKAPKTARRVPKEGAPARAARLVSLVSYLRGRGFVALTALAERFGVSPEEIHRDLYLLWTDVGRSSAGGDLLDFSWSDDESEVALMDSQGLDQPVRLAAVEAITLIAALRSLEEVGGLSEASAAASARGKLEEALGPANVIEFRLPQGGAGLETVREAISRGRRLSFKYVNQAGQVSQRQADPLEVFSAGDHWLVAAWDLAAGAERHFRVDRIVAPEILAEASGPHPHRAERSGWSGRAGLVVDAVFAPSQRWRAEELEALAPPLPLEGGTLQVKLGVVNPDWIVAIALGGGGDIEVLSPPEVRGRIAQAAGAALRRALR
jgi:predicted DNA-binding transcriptional regulator YafY